jgi:quinol monooxygenase YgiN
MESTMSVQDYSIAVWMIKPGREEEFISTWRDFAQWTAERNVGAVSGTLVQDSDEPRRFFCFWPFKDREGISKWRSDPKFREFMMRMRAYCENCQPSIARQVGFIGETVTFA